MSSQQHTYVSYINSKIIQRFSHRQGVVFGQNVVAGSRISGLGAGIELEHNITSINTPNAENTLMGFGLGLMLGGIDSAFIMKQHDFALLGLDQITNTVNVLKNQTLEASFMIIMVVVDSGFEGPQASLNNLDEFASLSRTPVRFLNTTDNIDRAFSESTSPGFHMMALSQKCMKLKLDPLDSRSTRLPFGELIKSSDNADFLLVFFGLDLAILNETITEALEQNIKLDYVIAGEIADRFLFGNLNLGAYRSVVVCSTSKSEVTYAEKLAFELMKMGMRVTMIGRASSKSWSQVSEDSPEFTSKDILTVFSEPNNEK
jgi:hypothetical protein